MVASPTPCRDHCPMLSSTPKDWRAWALGESSNLSLFLLKIQHLCFISLYKCLHKVTVLKIFFCNSLWALTFLGPILLRQALASGVWICVMTRTHSYSFPHLTPASPVHTHTHTPWASPVHKYTHTLWTFSVHKHTHTHTDTHTPPLSLPCPQTHTHTHIPWASPVHTHTCTPGLLAQLKCFARKCVLPQRPVVVSADGALSQLLYDAWLLAVSLLRQEVPPAGDWLLTIHPSGHQSGTHCLGSQNHGTT